MEICSNCFKDIPQKYPFCPFCGCPTVEVGLKKCSEGHIIYETCGTCPICGQIGNLGKSLFNPGNRFGPATELLRPNPQANAQGYFDKTSAEKTEPTIVFADRTVVESDIYDKTRIEDTFTADKTRLEIDSDKTIMDADITKPLGIQPFFAWLVFLGEDNKPVKDIRIDREKNIIGKGADADIRLNNEFASKLHALIYYEDGKFFLSDLNSANHTWLNEKKISKEELNDGDRIRIGRQAMIFKRIRRPL